MKRQFILNPISVTVAVCLVVMAYVLMRPAPDHSLRLTLVFPAEAGVSSAVPWRDGPDVLAAVEADNQTYTIEPAEIAAYEWSVHVLHLTPAGYERLRARFGGGDPVAVMNQIIDAQPGFVVTVGEQRVVAGAVVPDVFNDRAFRDPKAQPIVEHGSLRIRFELADQFVEPDTIADRRLYEAISATDTLAERCSAAGAPFEIRIANELQADQDPFQETPDQTLARLMEAQTVVRLAPSAIQRYSWPSGSFVLNATASQELVNSLGLPADFGTSRDPLFVLTLGGFQNGNALWAGQTRFFDFAPANDIFAGATFWVTAKDDRLTFEARETPADLDTLRGLRNLCVRHLFSSLEQLRETPRAP